MTRKITNIIVFTIAGICCILALVFAMRFDDNKKSLYDEISVIKPVNETLITDFNNVNVANLPDFLVKQNENKLELNTALKAKQLQKDILYTYLTELNDLSAETFDAYKTDFVGKATSLFAKADQKDKYTSGFNGVKDFIALEGYINSLEDEYATVKQDYLAEKEYVHAYSNFVKRVSDINDIVSESKKTNDLASLQNDVNTSTSESGILNTSMAFVYIIFAIAILLVILFSLWGIISSFKTSYKALVAVVALVVVFVIGYFIASPELSRSAINMGHTASEVRWIESGVFITYLMLLGAVLSIAVSPLINKFRKS
ncbi:MAG: hypothetical protein LBU51_08625 [Bacteroidales bacterium]|nr:hypothetical protein [Bacteroidales bacterium]